MLAFYRGFFFEGVWGVYFGGVFFFFFFGGGGGVAHTRGYQVPVTEGFKPTPHYLITTSLLVAISNILFFLLSV